MATVSGLINTGTTTLNSTTTIKGPIYFGSAVGSEAYKPILVYSETYPKYGICYNNSSVDKMSFSASGNADSADADLCINGAGNGTVTIRGKEIWHKGNLINVSQLTNDSGYLTSLPSHDHNSAYMRVIEQNSTFTIDAIPNNLAPGVHKIHISGKEYSSILCGNDYTGAQWQLYFHPHASYDQAIKYRYRDGAWRNILDSTNSQVSKEGETLTVKINGTEYSLTNTHPTNYVTTDTDQTISGAKTFSGNVTLMVSNQHNSDQFIRFKYSTTDLDNYSWRIGYLGSGSGNENRLVFQSNGNGSWANVLTLGLTDYSAVFSGAVTANAGFYSNSFILSENSYITLNNSKISIVSDETLKINTATDIVGALSVNGAISGTGGNFSQAVNLSGGGAGSTAISYANAAMTIGTMSRSNTAGTYYPGIAFNHMYGYNGGTTYRNHAHAWIGLKLHSTPAAELSYLVFATNGDSTNGTSPIERMSIAPNGEVNIINNLVVDGRITADSGFSGNLTGNVTGNASSATQLATARTITLGTAVTATATSFNGTSNITIPVTKLYQGYLDWGGKSLSGEVSPIGCALSNEHSANRLAFLSSNAIDITTSSNGGSSYSPYTMAAANKQQLVTTSQSVNIGPTTVATTGRTRILLGANGTGTSFSQQYVYTSPKKLLLNITTNGHGVSVLIEYATGANPTTFTTLGTYALSGWSGWNDIPLNGISRFGGSATQTSQVWYIRMTFAVTSVSSSYPSSPPQVLGIRMYGDNLWKAPSTMSQTGHLYSFDITQNATFPAKVNAVSGFFQTSDELLKKVVKPVTVDLDQLQQLRKVYFTWNKENNGELQLGMIAQDVQKLYPEIVNTDGDHLSLAYDKLSVVALKAIDELYVLIKDLQKENQELKQKLNSMNN